MALLGQKVDNLVEAINRVGAKLDDFDRRTRALETWQSGAEKDIKDSCDGVDKLNNRLNGWNVANSIGVIVAVALDFVYRQGK